MQIVARAYSGGVMHKCVTTEEVSDVGGFLGVERSKQCCSDGRQLPSRGRRRCRASGKSIDYLDFKTRADVLKAAYPCEVSARVNAATRSKSGLHSVDRVG